MGHVFVSYSHRDREFVNQLIEELQKAGVNIWRDLDLLPGSNWAREIGKALAEADALLLVWSEDAAASAYINAELLTATEMNKPIIPIIVSSKQDSIQLPISLASLYVLDLRNLSLDSAIQKILKALPKSARQESPQEPKKPLSKGYVFISYASQNQGFVEKLREFMKQRGYGYWDYKTTDRQYSLPFHLELESAVSGCSLMVCIQSPDWKKSTWSAKEYLFAEHLGKPIFVLKVADTEPTLLTIDKTVIDCVYDLPQALVQLDSALKRQGLI